MLFISLYILIMYLPALLQCQRSEKKSISSTEFPHYLSCIETVYNQLDSRQSTYRYCSDTILQLDLANFCQIEQYCNFEPVTLVREISQNCWMLNENFSQAYKIILRKNRNSDNTMFNLIDLTSNNLIRTRNLGINQNLIYYISAHNLIYVVLKNIFIYKRNAIHFPIQLNSLK